LSKTKSYYSDTVSCVKRLVREWEEHRKLIIAYEFDNTVFDTHNIGDSFEEVVQELKEADKLGLILVLFTGRTEEKIEEAFTYLKEQRIPYHYVNESPENIPFKSKKVFYNLLLDSRAGLGQALQTLRSLLAHIRSTSYEHLLTMEIG
jgi:predicted phosphatase